MRMTQQAIDPVRLRAALCQHAAGAFVSFEGWIRDENEGRQVLRLEYEAYEPLCLSEGGKVIEDARQRFELLQAECVHRTGALELGDCAVWVGVSAAHRDAAFAACRFIIDQVKVRLPIWKKEHYVDGDSGWVNCERCAAHAHEVPPGAQAL
ncbi:MAG: molybdenum cofactor biosynthesis protein MoaE [Gammaproteobacteria bacterium]|nr:MAG: molybdenum cofactor biosynthesis protein MoaE [Gammaproteobacteria bacterium]